MNSIIDKLILFFRNLFKKEPVLIKTNIENLPTLLEKSFVEKRIQIEEDLGKKITEIKYLHSKAKSIIKAIKESPLEEKPNERLNHAVETSKKQLLVQLEKLLEKINPSNVDGKLNSYREYAKKSEVLLAMEINNFRKNIAYTSYYHKDEMKELGEALQNIINTLHEMNQTINSGKELFEFENFKERIGSSLKKKKELVIIQKNIESLNEKIAEKQEEIKKQKWMTLKCLPQKLRKRIL
jgi:hypothetical protein